MTTEEPAYFIRSSAEGPVQGPFEVSRIKDWVTAGRVSASMEFSKNGADWWPGATWRDVFPEPKAARSPQPPAAPPAPAPARRRGQAPEPVRSRGASTRRPAQAARARRQDPETRSQRGGPRGRPQRRRPNPALLWIGILVVVGGSAALLYFAFAPSQLEQDLEQMVALMEANCEYLEKMAESGTTSELTMDMLTNLVEIQALKEKLDAAAFAGGNESTFKVFAPKMIRLVERQRRASARIRAQEDNPAPPVR